MRSQNADPKKFPKNFVASETLTRKNSGEKFPVENPEPDTLSSKRRLDLLYEKRQDLFLSISALGSAGFGSGEIFNRDHINNLIRRLNIVEDEIESLEKVCGG